MSQDGRAVGGPQGIAPLGLGDKGRGRNTQLQDAVPYAWADRKRSLRRPHEGAVRAAQVVTVQLVVMVAAWGTLCVAWWALVRVLEQVPLVGLGL